MLSVNKRKNDISNNNKHKRTKSLCYFPIRNGGTQCNCGLESHANIYKNLKSFVNAYNISRDPMYQIDVSYATYDDWSKYKFIEHVVEYKLMSRAYCIWLKNNKYVIDTKCVDETYQHIIVYLNAESMFVVCLDYNYIGLDITERRKFIRDCNRVKFIDKTYYKWLRSSTKQSSQPIIMDDIPCFSCITLDGKFCSCKSYSHKQEYDDFVNYATKNNIEVSYKTYEQWKFNIYTHPICLSPIMFDGTPCSCGLYSHECRYKEFVKYAKKYDIDVSYAQYEHWWLRIYDG
jgi:hypothetical protein